MSVTDIKLLVRRFVEEAQSRGNLDILEEALASDFVNHSAPPGVPPTREGTRQLFAAMRSAFPDLTATIHDQIAEGDKVVTRKTLTGIHRGPFFGIPPTGRRVSFGVIDIVRVVDGRIVEHWNEVDQLGLLRQLGAIPGTEGPSPNPT